MTGKHFISLYILNTQNIGQDIVEVNIDFYYNLGEIVGSGSGSL